MSGGVPNPLPGPSKRQALNDEPPAKDEHPPVRKQLKNLTAKKGKLPGHYGGDFSMEERVELLEAAVIALGIQEFGDLPGHEFHGNQYTNGGGDIKVGHVVTVKGERGDWVVKETDRKTSDNKPMLVVGKPGRSDYDYLKLPEHIAGRVHTAEEGSMLHEKALAGDLPKGDKVKVVDSNGGRIKTITLGTQEFGDTEGHPFHGNQWTSGGTGKNLPEDRGKYRDPNAYKGRKPEPPPPAPPPPPKPLTEHQLQRGVDKVRKDFETAIRDTLRDNPELSEHEVARDLAEAVSYDAHPEVKREFYRTEGFDFRPGERR